MLYIYYSVALRLIGSLKIYVCPLAALGPLWGSADLKGRAGRDRHASLGNAVWAPLGGVLAPGVKIMVVGELFGPPGGTFGLPGWSENLINFCENWCFIF